MLQNPIAATRGTALEFAIYRDGDNNLDSSQANVIDQARSVSAKDASIQFSVEDTSGPRGDVTTRTYEIDGGRSHDARRIAGTNMSSPENLARFVARSLDNAEKSGAKQTWLDLVDHGAGDGGGLEADSFGGVMPMQAIADAIARGVEMHARAHPEDTGRTIDGVAANQCLMSTLGFADALSHAGVKYLAASPETMLSPGVPSTVAEAIAASGGDAKAMAHGVVDDVMRTRYGAPAIGTFAPAAAFDVLDLAPSKIASMERAVKTFNDDAAREAPDAGVRDALRDDVGSVDGMVRFPDATPDMPWHADRPAIAVYDAIARDGRLDERLRDDAARAAGAVNDLVLAHRESHDFAPFGGSNYGDAAGPTIHDPLTRKQVDPWAPAVSETKNRFYQTTDQGSFAGAIA
jgi:hypothetical protein